MATVLIVDDQPGYRRLLEVTLRNAGYQVVTAADGAEAFQKVLTAKPDLILLDVMMPIVDGFRVLETLKSDSELRAIPVMMLTARDQAADVRQAALHDADFYMTKPFDRKDLLLAVQRLLQRDAPT